MFNLGFSEVLIILALLLVFFGAERMPEIGRAIGRAAQEFKRGLQDMTAPEEKKNNSYPTPNPYKKLNPPKKKAKKKARPGRSRKLKG